MRYVHDNLKRFPNHHLKLYHSMLQPQEHLEFRYSENLLFFFFFFFKKKKKVFFAERKIIPVIDVSDFSLETIFSRATRKSPFMVFADWFGESKVRIIMPSSFFRY